MCDVCDRENRDWKFHNGDKPLKRCKLYRVYVGREAQISLCHIHSIELFCIGENRFLRNHPNFSISLHHGTTRESSDIFAF